MSDFPFVLSQQKLTINSQIHPEIREDCKNSAKCAALAKHFEHCQEKVQAGEGFKGEDCVEELYVLFSILYVSSDIFAGVRDNSPLILN